MTLGRPGQIGKLGQKQINKTVQNRGFVFLVSLLKLLAGRQVAEEVQQLVVDALARALRPSRRALRGTQRGAQLRHGAYEERHVGVYALPLHLGCRPLHTVRGDELTCVFQTAKESDFMAGSEDLVVFESV